MNRITDAGRWLRKSLTQHVVLYLIAAFLITCISVTHYIVTMLLWTVPGFSLDDSWIHLQFARTIYEGHPWEYSPGYPSTGSTSPLWSIILSSLFFFTRDPIGLVWGTYLIATVFYSLCTFTVGRLIWDHTDCDSAALIGMIGFVMVPRNTWLMLSGMETPLFVFLLLLGVALLERDGIAYDLALGVVCGLAFLARPEGALLILLCVPLRAIITLGQKQMTWRRFASLVALGLIALLVILPWILYCLSVTGLPLPDTFYAKVHPPTDFEIAVWDFWWQHFIIEMPHIVIGATLGSAVLLRKRPYLWVLPIALTVLYRLNLPYLALINNARYLVPIFDLFMVAAVIGLARIFKWILKYNPKVRRDHLTEVLLGLILILLLIVPITPSYLQQAPFYGNSVKNINDQQVTIGKWLAVNTPKNAVLAIHDAGALRFFSNRTIIDLAGLVSPDIIHGNMSILEKLIYLREHGCNYFVFFDELMQFYLQLMPGAVTKLYSVHLTDNVISGRDTMSVYFVNWTLVTIID